MHTPMNTVGSVFLILLVSSLECAKFRCDYTYIKPAEGYFKYQEIPVTWEEARLRCFFEGATLASPLTFEIRSAMMNMTANGRADCGIYTGVHSTFSKGDYFSVEGIPLSNIPHTWAKGEPDNVNNEENCLAQMPDGTLADIGCNETLPYICYKKASKKLFMNQCGTTDNDYSLDSRTGNCYKFHRIGRTWSRAFMICAAEGGYLAIVNSETEAQVIRDLFAKNPDPLIPGPDVHKTAFVGFNNYWNDNREFLTIEGQTLQEAGYNKFSGGEPNNAAPGQSCGAINRSGLLDDMWCDKRAVFVCEKNPESLLCDQEKTR